LVTIDKKLIDGMWGEVAIARQEEESFLAIKNVIYSCRLEYFIFHE
jgi:hypothetical protein